MNERKKERMNEWIKERLKQRKKEGIKERKKERKKEGIEERKNLKIDSWREREIEKSETIWHKNLPMVF